MLVLYWKATQSGVCVEHGAQHAALQSSCVYSNCPKSVVPDSNRLGSASQEVQNTVAEDGWHPKSVQLVDQL